MGILSTFSRRTQSLLKTPPPKPTTPQPQPQPSPIPQAWPTKKPLHALFTEVVGLSDQTQSDNDEQSAPSQTGTELKNNLKQLEQELKTLKEKRERVPSKKMTLYATFTNKQSLKPKSKEQSVVIKKLSPDMVMFAQYLFENGYFNDANFVRGKKNFDPAWFDTFFAVGYVKFATHKFATDNREIAKWLSGSALKQVAVFGCPHTHKNAVFPAKRLRRFFEVPENTVCSGCSLRQSCRFANQNVWNCESNNLDFVTVMKVITSYALGSVHPQLVVPDEVKKSVSQLLKEVVKLSQTT